MVKFWLFQFALANILDFVSTVYGLSNGLASEVNPFAYAI